MMRGGPLYILGHGVIGQGKLCPPARGCHALRCLVSYLLLQKLGNFRTIQIVDCLLLSPRNRVGGDIVTRPFVGGWVSEWVGSWVRAWVSAWFRHALPCGHDSDYSFCSINFKLHMHICHDERRNPIDFGSRGQRSMSTLALCTYYIKPCGHDSDYSFYPITFKLHMHIRHDERRNPIDFGSRGQRSRSTLALCT